MFKVIVVLLFLCFSENSLAQVDCKSIANKKMQIAKNELPKADALEIDLEILSNCASFDEIDHQFFSSSMLAFIVTTLLESKKPLTYGVFLNEIKKIKQQAIYTSFRKSKTAYLKLSNVRVSKESMMSNSDLIDDLFFNDQIEKEKFEIYTQSIESKYITFSEALQQYSIAEQAKKVKKESITSFKPYTELKNLDSVTVKLIDSNKPILIYFSSDYCINCRKMESEILGNETVKNYINDSFITFQANYTIDNNIQNDYYENLQLQKFQSDIQPYFVVIDKFGNKIHELIGNEKNPKLFEAFLKAAILKFRK